MTDQRFTENVVEMAVSGIKFYGHIWLGALMLFAVASALAADAGSRRMIAREDLVATIGGARVAVFQDSKFTSDFILYDGDYCWVVNVVAKAVYSPGCALFRFEANSLVLDLQADSPDDVYWSEAGQLQGVEWLDVALGCSSLFSVVFRAPQFDDDGVAFWACDKQGWAKMVYSPNESR
jgi:hypothetical protein